MSSFTSARQSEVKAWEEEIESTACEHTLCLEQLQNGTIPQGGEANLLIKNAFSFHIKSGASRLLRAYLNFLYCSALGCGRAQFGGVGGNGHALAHFNTTQHPVCVKLGTITPEGGAGQLLFLALIISI